MNPIYNVNRKKSFDTMLFSIEKSLCIYLIGNVALPLIITYAFLVA